MEIAIRALILIVSFIFVIKGGDWFVDSAADIAKRTRIPQVVIGATIVSFATTFPELLVAILSSVEGSVDLAVGDAVGSCLFNTGIICGLALVIMPTLMPPVGKLKFFVLPIVSLFVMILAFFGQVELWQGIVLIVFAIAFFVVNVLDAKKTQQQEEDKKQQPGDEQKQEEEQKLKPLWKTILLFVIGVVCLGGGSWLMVREATFLAEVIGISEQFIGLTIVAVGTSLPELTTMFISIKKKQPHITIGNIVGSNILNLTLILGSSRLFSGAIPVDAQSMYLTLPILFVMTALFMLPIIFKNKTYRWQGIAFLSLYVAYFVFLIVDIFMPIV